VIEAWRRAYHSHLPSKGQRAILSEVLIRRSPEWIADALTNAHLSDDDPFRVVLQRDRDLSARDLTEASSREELWAEQKQRESDLGTQSLAELIGVVRTWERMGTKA
jgi:hypothetical protein